MSPESSRFSRRDLLKFGGITSLLVSAYAVAPEVVTAYYLNDKEHRQPLLKDLAHYQPTRLGIYPHKNELRNTPLASNFPIIGYFPTWQDWRVPDIERLSSSQTPMLSLAPSHEQRERSFRHQDVIEQKQHIRQQAAQYRGVSNLYVRYGYEMNGNWFPYGRQTQKPSEFVEGWKVFAHELKSVLPQVQLVWSPNVDEEIEAYYPTGDYEPDIIGLDGYNKHNLRWDHVRRFNPNPTFQQLFTKDIRLLQDISNKPIWITEIGVELGSMRTSQDWLIDALLTAPLYERVDAVCLFAWNKDRGWLDSSEADWRGVLTTQLLATIQASNLYEHFSK